MTYEELKELTVQELKAKCKALKLEGYSKLKEEELIKTILKAETEEAETEEAETEEAETEEAETEVEKTSRKFKKIVDKPIAFGAVVIKKEVKEFEVTEEQLKNSKLVKKLENAIGKFIEEI